MKMKFWLCFILSGGLALMSGCIGTEDGHSVAGVPFSKDTIISRYARPVTQLAAATRTVLMRNGRLTMDNTVNNTFSAKINKATVWVKVSDVDGRITEVSVQARGAKGDIDLAAEISKQIGMMLVAG